MLDFMLVWLNGTFGVGKTTTAIALVEADDRYRLFDPEQVGYMLTANLKGVAFADFQDLLAWRQLVPVVARHIASSSGQRLVAVQTVLNRDYWSEIRRGLAAEGFSVMHVVLDAGVDALETRIQKDEEEPAAKKWRLEHIDAYLAARRWLIEDADLVVDVSQVSSADAAKQISRALA
jgi:adenylylsulfate kinase-like enzyme